ncbi:cytochrome P450 [Brevibacterium moorei]|uniref:cytochrome P450 n=1 Tax=Brevibacterium moorei TaxID=2968457 RepID=UPI00211C6C22|nr:cytochrome P450 [Brevibacterium sp. 68QC2CO]MCQ9386746.1 cytochrome P450 [Brevibacterium sp. 68QC2CO]
MSVSRTTSPQSAPTAQAAESAFLSQASAQPEAVAPVPADAYASLPDDPYSRVTLADPYPFLTRLREAGAAVWLERYGVYAFGRDAEVRAILDDWQTFISGAGVGPANYAVNRPAFWRPGILEVDPPIHTRMRQAMSAVISPGRLRARRADFDAYARELLDEVLGSAEAAAAVDLDVFDLAKRFTLRVFGDAVGIPRADRDPKLILQGAMNFSRMGPMNEVAREHFEAADGVVEWVMEACARDRLAPGGMGAQIWEFADSGDILDEEATLLVRAMLSAGLDTTVLAIVNTLVALSRHPAQYARLRADPGLMKYAIDECFRFDSPFQSFFRTTSRDVEIGQVTIPAGSKLIVFPGAANRDPARWGDDADSFDMERDASGHLTFGMGIHMCVGQPISRMEMDSFFAEFLRRVSSLEPLAPAEPYIHTTLRSYASAPMRLHLG